MKKRKPRKLELQVREDLTTANWHQGNWKTRRRCRCDRYSAPRRLSPKATNARACRIRNHQNDIHWDPNRFFSLCRRNASNIDHRAATLRRLPGMAVCICSSSNRFGDSSERIHWDAAFGLPSAEPPPNSLEPNGIYFNPHYRSSRAVKTPLPIAPILTAGQRACAGFSTQLDSVEYYHTHRPAGIIR